jgi:RNA ligase
MNKKILDKYVEEGWVIKQSHPTLPLSIYNYSQATQYEKKWDEITLACRGLIVDDSTGEVIIKSFPKFFNYEEVAEDIPWTSSDYVYVQEKMDGSLGILFNYKGEWIMATRGSFTSVQAIKGLEMVKARYNDLRSFEPAIAYLCEIIYNENRIVVKYDFEKVVFLGAAYNTSWNWDCEITDELNWTTACVFFKCAGIEKYDIVETNQVFNLNEDLYKTLKKKNEQNKEGFVLRFFPSNKRVKIKFEDYCALHRILTQCSSYDIWENLMKFNKIPEELLKDVPDEFYDWVRAQENALRDAYSKIEADAYRKFDEIFDRVAIYQTEFDKMFANEAKFYKNSGLLFSIKNNKSIREAIWKMIKPEFEKPFLNS